MLFYQLNNLVTVIVILFLKGVVLGTKKEEGGKCPVFEVSIT